MLPDYLKTTVGQFTLATPLAKIVAVEILRGFITVEKLVKFLRSSCVLTGLMVLRVVSFAGILFKCLFADEVVQAPPSGS